MAEAFWKGGSCSLPDPELGAAFCSLEGGVSPSPAPLRALTFHSRARGSQVTPNKTGEMPLWARSAKGGVQEDHFCSQVSIPRCWLSFPYSFPSSLCAHLSSSCSFVLLLPRVGVGATSLLLCARHPSPGSSWSSIIIEIM